MPLIKRLSGVALSFHVLELDDPGPRRPIQSLLCLSANQIKSSSIQELAERVIMEPRFGNYLFDIADRGRGH